MSAPAHWLSERGRGRGVFVVRATELRAAAGRRLGFVDVTDRIELELMRTGIEQGACTAFCIQPSCALVINEWGIGAQRDLSRRLGSLFTPQSSRTQVAQILLGGASLTIPVRDGTLWLGRRQRVVLVELGDPRQRTIALQLIGTSAGSGASSLWPSYSMPAP
jgi:thiamine phosphate synthase YjbQ (UPF0047 family)